MFSSFRTRVVPVLALVAALAAPASAQQTESRIVGKVTDQSGAALPGVTVNVTGKATGSQRSTVTEGEGDYAVTNLAPGAYTVQVELSGFQTRTQDVVLGVGQVETMNVSLGVGGVQETVNVTASAPVLDVSSARLGVNVSPEEVENLPVNGRNFANLMTLATGATSDGNGGWASVRFNGKSNQQNYLNYDGVDGTYVWDATPGYLNATGSQFRLQTSMESIAEFRVNSGLAPAESGLGSGGNITVISKSGQNQFNGSLFEFIRNDALDAASKYDDKKQELSLNQFGGSIGGPVARNRTFFFASFEGLQQTTGLSFSEAVPSAEAIRRIMAGEPVGSGAGQSSGRTQAVAALLGGFPQGTTPTSNPLLALATNTTEAKQDENAASFRLDHRLNSSHSFYARYLFSDGEVDTPDRTATPRRVLAKQRPQNVVLNFQSVLGGNMVNEVKVGYNRPHVSALAFGATPGYDPIGVSLSGTVTSSSIDARGTSGIARSGLLIRASSASSTVGSIFRPSSISLSDSLTWNKGAHTVKSGGEFRQIQSQFQFLGSTEITYNSINDFIDNRPNAVAVALDSPVFKPQQYYLIGFVQDSWRATETLTLELGLRYDFYSVVKEANANAKPFFIEENAFSTDPDNFYDADKNNISPRLSAAYQLNDKTAIRAGFGLFYHRTAPRRRRRRAEQRPAVPLQRRGAPEHPPDSRLHAPPPRRVQHAIRCERLPRTTGGNQPDGGLHGQPGQGHVPSWCGQHPEPHDTGAGDSGLRADRLQDLWLPGRRGHQRQLGLGLRLGRVQRLPAQRDTAVPRRLHRRSAVSILDEQGHDPGLQRSGDSVEHVRLQQRVRHEPTGHPAHVQWLVGLPGARKRHLDRWLAHRRHRQRQERRSDQRRAEPSG